MLVLAIVLALITLLMPNLSFARAREIVLPPPTDGMEGEATARPPTGADFKATHVNRCPGPNGTVVLQDSPCAPVTATATPLATATSTDVVELSTLAPRPLPGAKASADESSPSRRWTSGLLDGAWKLGLLVLAGYLLVRGVASVRAWLRQRNHGAELR